MSKKVMIVDDEELVLYTVRKILQGSGFEVLTASSGDGCLKILKKGFKGLILMDIAMPDMDGWDTVQAIVDAGLLQGNIICMLTGKEVPDIKMDTLKEYVLDYIRKPFEGKKLVQIVGEYLSYLKES